jgi:hypothetical protein
MAGMPDKNREAFFTAEEYLRLKGTPCSIGGAAGGAAGGGVHADLPQYAAGRGRGLSAQRLGRSHGAGIEYTYALYQGRRY